MNQDFNPYNDIVKSLKKTLILKKVSTFFKFLVLIGLPYVIVSSMFVSPEQNTIQIVAFVTTFITWVFTLRAYNHSNMISKVWIWLEDTKAKKGTII